MQLEKILLQLCSQYALGNMRMEPQPVTGGLLHRMYHVVTDRGEYAIKLLNADIVKRPHALHNTVNSERIARNLAHILPAVAALECEGHYLLSVSSAAPVDTDIPKCPETDDLPMADKSYALVYPWLEARSIFAPEITAAHCGEVGRMLGQLHHANLQLEGIEREEAGRPLYDWQGYLNTAKAQQIPWLSDYEAMLPDLIRWDRAAVASMEAVSSLQVISHRDLDPKNILWQGDKPWIIDWEAAGYVNPYQELLEVLNYWGRGTDGDYDSALCHELLRAYTQFGSLEQVDWTPVFACSYDGMLGWLEYVLKKALGLEGDETARVQGRQQLAETYAELSRCDAQSDRLREIIAQTPSE